MKMETIVKKRSKARFIGKQDNTMTATQIRKNVGEAWAFLENPVYEKGVLVSANLLYYNTDKSKVLEELAKYKKGHYAMLYFGTIDTEQVYIL
jgi:uncharacterized membrane protein YcaP (DUF421 family)